MNAEFRLTPDALRLIRSRIAIGDEDWEIAGRLGCSIATLWDICSNHGFELKGDRLRVLATMVALPDGEMRSFASEAARRGVSAQRLMADCLAVIAKDGLFLAVLGE